MDLREWHDFYLATAGAAAALTGLIFVGVSINIKKILSLPKLPDRALISLFLLLAILIISSMMLIPFQASRMIGTEMAIISVLVYSVVTKMDIGIYKGTPHKYKKQYRTSIIFNQVSLVPYLAAALAIFLYQDAGMYWLVPGIIVSFIKAIVDAWVLLVEINR